MESNNHEHIWRAIIMKRMESNNHEQVRRALIMNMYREQ